MKQSIAALAVAGKLPNHEIVEFPRLPGYGASPQHGHERRPTRIAVILASTILFAVVVLPSKTLQDAGKNRGMEALATTHQVVDGLHIALPNNLKYIPIEQLVPLP